jgi:predicted AAA+ superfamily ATPase
LIEGLQARADLARVHEFWFKGGFPEPWLAREETFRAIWVEQYLQTYLFRDVRRLYPGLDEPRFRRFLGMLGGSSGRVLNYADTARALGVSQPTARDYFDIAHGTFLWRTIPAFTRNVVKRVVKHPKGYFRDSGLLHALLRIPDTDALLSHPQIGASWEGMVVEELVRQLNALGAAHECSYYRTGAGAEVDLVLDAAFGRIAVQIKHSSAVGGHDLRVLRDFVAAHQARLGLVINNDVTPRLYEANVVGVPFAFL